MKLVLIITRGQSGRCIVPTHTTINFTDAFYERFSRLVPSGQRSEFIVRSVNKELDKIDLVKLIETDKEDWLIKNVKPVVSDILDKKTRYEILGYYADNKRSELIDAVNKKLKVVVESDHMDFIIKEVLHDRQ